MPKPLAQLTTCTKQGFARHYRLGGREAFDKVFQSGARSSNPYFSLYACHNALPHPRLGIAVSRKVSRRAVVRNRIKRQIRESFRQQQAQIAGLDVVVVGKPSNPDRPDSSLPLPDQPAAR